MNVTSLPTGPLLVNCYLICDDNSKACAVVDPGGDADKIIEKVKTLDHTIQAILLTHGHYDHTGAVEELVQHYPNIPVYISADEPLGADEFPELHVPLTKIKDGDTVTVGGLSFDVMATPGHSAGSVTYRIERILLTGDTLFAGSCGRTDFYTGDYHEMMSSLRRLAELNGDYSVYPGHMNISSLEREREINPFVVESMS